MPQLVQVLKYEPYHYSALAHFLLQRALRNRRIVGHYFFWYLKAELHNRKISPRYLLLIGAYLTGCGEYKEELFKQLGLVNELATISEAVKSAPM